MASGSRAVYIEAIDTLHVCIKRFEDVLKTTAKPPAHAMTMSSLDECTTVPYENVRYTHSRGRRCLFSCAGNFVGVSNLPNAFRSLRTAINRKLYNAYPDRPFIPYCAIDALAPLLSKDMAVVEIGAGMSTLWLAERTRRVTSYEWDPAWLATVKQQAAHRHLDNIDVRLCPEGDPMAFADIPQESISLGFIDGGQRSLCLFNLWPKIKRGGFVYLDNWDSDLFWLELGIDARAFLRDRRNQITRVQLFVDFIPTQVCVCEGLLVQKA